MMTNFDDINASPDLQPRVTPEISEDQLPTIRELVAGLLSHLWVVAICLVLGVIAGWYYSSAPRRYTSVAILRIQPSNGSGIALSTSQTLSGASSSDEKINSELAIMGGRTILLKVADDLHLIDNPDFWGTKTPPHLNMADPKTRDIVMARMHAILLFTREPKSDIVEISCITPSPMLSSQIPNTITNEYIARIFQVRYSSTERVAVWLSAQLNELRDQVEHDQKQLVILQDKLGVLGLNQGNNTYLLADSLESLTKASSEATIQRILAEAKLRVLSDSDPNLIEGEQPPLQGPAGVAGLLPTLRASQAEAAANYANLSAKLGSNYPDVRQAKARLDELNRAVATEQKRILNQAKTAYSAASSNEHMTANALKELQTKAFTSRDDMVTYVVLERQYVADRELYETLMQRLRVAGINAGLESAQVDIVDQADISSIPKNPLPYQWFLFLSLGGLVVGVILAILIDRLDTRLRKPSEAERKLNLPVLSVLQTFVPVYSAGKGTRFAELQSGAYAEGQQLLRSSVLLSKPDRPPNSILVTSSIAGEGKSTVSRGLAAMLAMHNARVLLIDADLHRPSQGLLLDSKPARGLSDVLTSSIDPTDVIVPAPGRQGLFVMPAGPLPPNPATLLSSKIMRETVDQMKKMFDFVVIDSPPVLLLSDTILCASLVDVVVLVVRENMAELNEVRQTINLLRRARGNVIGFVMNATTHRGSGYGSYYQGYGQYGNTPDDRRNS
jgi:capsular exopolysaccharide synthesis family protein